MSKRHEVRIEDSGGYDEIEVVAVFVEVGATVAEGDSIVEVATDKANQDITAQVAGTVVEIAVNEDDIISPDQLLAVIEEAA